MDPFGPHPVVMAGSHDLSVETSAKADSDLLIIENVSGIATEYAVHLLGLFDHYRMRFALAALARKPAWIGLQPTDNWQDRYFSGEKRREFNPVRIAVARTRSLDVPAIGYTSSPKESQREYALGATQFAASKSWQP